MITQITYERLFNLGSYESERISATCSVEDGDVDAAYATARDAVMAQHKQTIESREAAPPAEPAPNGGATYAEPPASDKQRAYIAALQDKIGWTSEQLAAYAADWQADIALLTKGQASALIGELQVLEKGRRAAAKPGVVEEVDLPF